MTIPFKPTATAPIPQVTPNPTAVHVMNETPLSRSDISRALSALESIAASLAVLANGPTRAGKPVGPGIAQSLDEIADVLKRREKF